VTEEKRAMIKNLAKLDENTFTKEYVGIIRVRVNLNGSALKSLEQPS
jgi:hypothetical protein